MLVQYYSLNPNSPEAIALKQKIIDLSVAYGVISPFTSFGNPSTVVGPEETFEDLNIPGNYKLVENYPNPFNPSTTIKFIVNKNITTVATLRIYNSAGVLVAELKINLRGKGIYEAVWNAENFASGVYFYSVDFGDEILTSKMLLLK
ncbi:MAG: T9SS type A sorting domain-containing protein [Ignavibacteria bacterium]